MHGALEYTQLRNRWLFQVCDGYLVYFSEFTKKALIFGHDDNKLRVGKTTTVLRVDNTRLMQEASFKEL